MIIRLDPFTGIDPVKAIDSRLENMEPGSEILLNIDGYFNSIKHGITEKEMNDYLGRLKAKKKEIVKITFNALDLSDILEDNLYKLFIEKTEKGSYDDQLKTEMKEYLLKAMTGTY